MDALGSFSTPESVTALAALARGDGPSQLRLRAVRALGRTGAPSAPPVVLAALASARSDGERLVAVDALTALRPPDAVPPLTALLEQTRSDELRTRIAAALGAIRHGDAQPSLVVLLGDANPGVRYVAVQSLRAIGRSDAAAPLAALSLGITRRLHVRPVADLLADTDRVLGELSVQEVALRALTELDAATIVA